MIGRAISGTDYMKQLRGKLQMVRLGGLRLQANPNGLDKMPNYRKTWQHDGVFGQNLDHRIHPTRIDSKLPVHHTQHEANCPNCAISLLDMTLVMETCGHHGMQKTIKKPNVVC